MSRGKYCHPSGSTSVVNYVRWGQASCRQGSDLVYSGWAGKGSSAGGGVNYLCFPDNPEYSKYGEGVPIHIVEGVRRPLLNDTLPCAMCAVSERTMVMMVPARLSCPSGWALEYAGYLMSESSTFGTFECIDGNTLGGVVDRGWGVANHSTIDVVRASCDSFKCPPYNEEKELLCVVCTK